MQLDELKGLSSTTSCFWQGHPCIGSSTSDSQCWGTGSQQISECQMVSTMPLDWPDILSVCVKDSPANLLYAEKHICSLTHTGNRVLGGLLWPTRCLWKAHRQHIGFSHRYFPDLIRWHCHQRETQRYSRKLLTFRSALSTQHTSKHMSLGHLCKDNGVPSKQQAVF